uniref:Uncharacterized protein n=1 Tax=Timema poppense TaxID=170557 RepID=A0A7R9CID3_TIMPO|nr:unnamed protein product [Timema poppensis]
MFGIGGGRTCFAVVLETLTTISVVGNEEFIKEELVRESESSILQVRRFNKLNPDTPEWFGPTRDFSRYSYRNEIKSFYEDFKRISAHVAMSMQKGKQQGGQGYSQLDNRIYNRTRKIGTVFTGERMRISPADSATT